MRAIRTRIAVAAVAVSGAMSLSGVLGLAPASAQTPPTISSLTFTAPVGASLDNPQGVAVDGVAIDVANTADNVVASVVGTTTSTIAGSYEGFGDTGNNGLATAATLASPAGLGVDSGGDLFVADTEDNVVREITTSGIIIQVAGNEKEGYSGDGGNALKAKLDAPQDVAVNAAGDVYIADTDNNVIREVTPKGKISTFAGTGKAGYSGDGGKATKAKLTSPTGVAVDALGNVYIADAGNSLIRRVSTTGVITTVAGNYVLDQSNDGKGGFSGDGGPATSAQLNSPQGVALDQSGDLFIADTFNNAIREVTPAGTISTIVNTTGKKGSAGNGGPATAANLNSPYAVAVSDGTGNVYIADTSNNRIRVVTGLPIPTFIAGGPTAP